jgi:hypothetical protein
MNKVTEQRCHALTAAFVSVFGTTIGLRMHDWCHSIGGGAAFVPQH